MKDYNIYIFVGLFSLMFLLQIWVAQAERIDVKKLSPLAVRALNKIDNDPDLRSKVGLSSKNEQSKASNKSRFITKAEKGLEKKFVWYKPWTWFK